MSEMTVEQQKENIDQKALELAQDFSYDGYQVVRRELFAHLRELGFGYCLLSNNQIERVSSFADAIGAQFIENAHKPSVRNYKKAMELLGTDTGNTIFIGDQLFTDVYGAKRSGIRNILVKPIHPKEEIQIVLKRYLEKIVLHFYKKEEGIS